MMTGNMLRALSAANKAEPQGGLCYTVGGFVDPKNSFEYHGFLSCNALERRGYLWRYGKGKHRRLAITPEGEEALREALAERAA